MAKFKVGDIVKPVSMWDTGYHSYLIPGSKYKVLEEDDGVLVVEGKFNKTDSGEGWSEDWFELAESKTTAESLRNSILDIRSKREALQKEILRLDEQEKEAVEKLKEQGFVLYEDNVSKESVATENKAVLYAEDIEEDMTNPSNWKVGDVIEAITQGYNNRLGVLYALTEIGDEVHYTCLEEGFCKNEFVDKEEMACLKSHYKFHSRPVK